MRFRTVISLLGLATFAKGLALSPAAGLLVGGDLMMGAGASGAIVAAEVSVTPHCLTHANRPSNAARPIQASACAATAAAAAPVIGTAVASGAATAGTAVAVGAGAGTAAAAGVGTAITTAATATGVGATTSTATGVVLAGLMTTPLGWTILATGGLIIVGAAEPIEVLAEPPACFWDRPLVNTAAFLLLALGACRHGERLSQQRRRVTWKQAVKY
jgi:hypothetical protein